MLYDCYKTNFSYKESLFNSKWLSKFMNCFFFKGQKIKIELLVYNSFFLLKKFLNTNGLLLLFETLEKLKPWIGLKLKIGKKQKKVQAYPIILTSNIQYTKAIYWLIKSIQIRKEKNFSVRMCNEISCVIFTQITNSLKKKQEYYNYAVSFKSINKFKW